MGECAVRISGTVRLIACEVSLTCIRRHPARLRRRGRAVVTLWVMNGPGLRGEDRRADRRYKVNFHVHVARGEMKEVEGEVTDFCAGGCFVTSDEQVREDDLVKLRLDIPGHGDLT